jgi:hypothetical protein
VPNRIVAGVQQHGPAADLERRQGTDIDTALLRAGHPGHHGRQIGGPASGMALRSAPSAYR